MKDYAEVHGEHIRLSILRILAKQPSYQINDSILTQMVSNGLGLACTRDQMRGHIAWLDEQGLIKAVPAEGASRLTLARLTESGGEVASGMRTVPGVQRPSPGE
ncbi:VpaChn25_0724 family phage protein [Sphingorhabdus sp. 109]|uniref:VpaChn25_0724 family phage protein n=1 Tax=Sphingorhabdus sp. 109 TaxID=2653173 RepID=UPI0012F227BF|nr:ArsR family transcriptional regulator [Sphingorhabdus sp. 109]VWX62562.1 conserved hypothetical protein [Sphingorhabdus sp. 109]